MNISNGIFKFNSVSKTKCLLLQNIKIIIKKMLLIQAQIIADTFLKYSPLYIILSFKVYGSSYSIKQTI